MSLVSGLAVALCPAQATRMAAEGPTVAAVAGRRVDAPGAPARFPAGAVPVVAAAVKAFLAGHGVVAVVASAACGADIVALEAALELGIRTRIVLPFERGRFRRTSVEDRGIEWGSRYQAVIERADGQGDLVVLDDAKGSDDDAYARANARILAETLDLAHLSHARCIALAIWDEKPRSGTDATRDFLEAAKGQGMIPFSIRTDAVP
jgi:hypothetical protein